MDAALPLTVLAQAGTALAAGTALLRPFDRTRRPAGRVVWAAAGIAATALLLLAVGGPRPLATGIVLAAAVLVLPATLGRPWPALVAGVLVGGAVGGALAIGDGPVRVGLSVAGEIAAALWLGAVRAPSGPSAGYPRVLSLTGAGVLLAAWGAELLLDRTQPAPGAITAVRAALTITCLALLASTVRGYPVSTRPQVVGVTLVVALAAIGSASRPVAVPTVGQPVLASVDVAGQRVPVLIAPGRPGWNLVHLGAGATSVGPDAAHPVMATARPGAGNTWAEVFLQVGRSRWWIGAGRDGGWLTIDAGSDRRAADLRSADGPECASQALGRLLSARAEPLLSCPADQLAAADTEALRATVRFVAGRGTTAIGLTTDGSPRGVAAAAAVRAEAARLRLAVGPQAAGKPLFVVAGWDTADRTVRAVASGSSRAEAVYLAPWLLHTPLLSAPAGQLIPLRFEPRGPGTLGYLSALGTRFPGEAPSAAGYTGWYGPGLDVAPVRLYAASRMFVPGDSLLSAPHQHAATGSADWLPNGAVTAISAPWPAV